MSVWTDRNLRRDILVEVAAGLIVLVIGAVGARVLPLVKWGLMYPAVFLPFLGGAVLMAGATLLAGWLVRRCRAPQPRMPYFRIKDAAVCVSSDGKVADSLKMVLEAISLAGEVTVSNNRFALSAGVEECFKQGNSTITVSPETPLRISFEPATITVRARPGELSKAWLEQARAEIMDKKAAVHASIVWECIVSNRRGTERVDGFASTRGAVYEVMR